MHFGGILAKTYLHLSKSVQVLFYSCCTSLSGPLATESVNDQK